MFKTFCELSYDIIHKTFNSTKTEHYTVKIMNETLIIFFLFLGVLTRTFIPALRKMLSDPNFEWNHKYTATAIISLIISTISALSLYQTFNLPEGAAAQVAIAAYFAGLGVNSGIDELAKTAAAIYNKI